MCKYSIYLQTEGRAGEPEERRDRAGGLGQPAGVHCGRLGRHLQQGRVSQIRGFQASIPYKGAIFQKWGPCIYKVVAHCGKVSVRLKMLPLEIEFFV